MKTVEERISKSDLWKRMKPMVIQKINPDLKKDYQAMGHHISDNKITFFHL